MSSIVRFSSWNVNPPTLRTMLAMMWFAASDVGWPSDQPGVALRALLDAEEPVGVQAERAGAEVGQRVQRVADDHPHAGERRVQPVDRRLPVLEVVQVDPAAGDAVDAGDRPGHRPVRLLHALPVEDHPLQTPDDVAALVQDLLGDGVEVDRVPPGRDVRQVRPVPLLDLDHVIDAGVVRVTELGEPEVGALAGVAGHDVVDDGAAVPGGGRAHPAELVLGAERRVDLVGDPVEVTVHAGRRLPAGDPAGPLHRSGVDGLDADLLERLPQALVAERAEERRAGRRDQRDRVRGEPDRRRLHGLARARVGERVLPHRALAGELAGQLVGVAEHGLVDQPGHVSRGSRRRPGRPGRPSAAGRRSGPAAGDAGSAGGPGGSTPRT